MIGRIINWLQFKLFSRWFLARTVTTDPGIKEEFGTMDEFSIENRINGNREVWIAPLPPEADYSPGTWTQPKGKP